LGFSGRISGAMRPWGWGVAAIRYLREDGAVVDEAVVQCISAHELRLVGTSIAEVQDEHAAVETEACVDRFVCVRDYLDEAAIRADVQYVHVEDEGGETRELVTTILVGDAFDITGTLVGGIPPLPRDLGEEVPQVLIQRDDRSTIVPARAGRHDEGFAASLNAEILLLAGLGVGGDVRLLIAAGVVWHLVGGSVVGNLVRLDDGRGRLVGGRCLIPTASCGEEQGGREDRQGGQVLHDVYSMQNGAPRERFARPKDRCCLQERGGITEKILDLRP